MTFNIEGRQQSNLWPVYSENVLISEVLNASILWPVYSENVS